MNTKKTGDLSVAKFLVKFLENGIIVAEPWGDCDKYDLVIDIGNKLFRVQCKTGWLDNTRGIIRFNKRSITTQSGKHVCVPYESGDFDLYAIYYPETDDYLICGHDIGGRHEGHFRLEKAKNGQTKNVHMKNDYLFDKWLETQR